jgi:hypothetical protein
MKTSNIQLLPVEYIRPFSTVRIIGENGEISKTSYVLDVYSPLHDDYSLTNQEDFKNTHVKKGTILLSGE